MTAISLTFDEIHAFMTEPVMLFTLIGVFALVVLLFVVFGFVLGTGRKKIIQQKNFKRLLGTVFVGGMLLAFLVYPFHLFLFTDVVMTEVIRQSLKEFIIIEAVLGIIVALLMVDFK